MVLVREGPASVDRAKADQADQVRVGGGSVGPARVKEGQDLVDQAKVAPAAKGDQDLGKAKVVQGSVDRVRARVVLVSAALAKAALVRAAVLVADKTAIKKVRRAKVLRAVKVVKAAIKRGHRERAGKEAT